MNYPLDKNVPLSIKNGVNSQISEVQLKAEREKAELHNCILSLSDLFWVSDTSSFFICTRGSDTSLVIYSAFINCAHECYGFFSGVKI